jgi:uncharacterized protein
MRDCNGKRMSARPFIKKIIDSIPLYVLYKPMGIPMENLEIEQLSIEEVEALKLKDSHGLSQASAAKKMGISRSTFQRLLNSARKKMIDSILEGKALKFEGGNYIPEKDMIRSKCVKGNYHFFLKKEDLAGTEQDYRLSKIKCGKCGKRLIDFK